MLNNQAIEEIEQIICYHFKDKQLLVNLFNKDSKIDHQGLIDGEIIFENTLHCLIDKALLVSHSILNEQQEIFDYRKEWLLQDEPFFYYQFKRLGLTKYLPFDGNDLNNARLIYQFVYLLFNAIALDSKSNHQAIEITFSKLTYFAYWKQAVKNHDHRDYLNQFFKVDWDFATRRTPCCKDLIMEINSSLLTTYYEQDAHELYSYLYHCFIDLTKKSFDNEEGYKDLFSNVDFNQDLIAQFEAIAAAKSLNTGYLYLHDEYYWYCLVMVDKFEYACFAHSEKKEEAKKQAVWEFLKFYQKPSNNQSTINDNIHLAIRNAFNWIEISLDFAIFPTNNTLKFDFKNKKANHLKVELNDDNIFTWSIFQSEKNQTKCTLLVAKCPVAFSAHGTNESNSLTKTCELLIKHYTY